MATKKKLLQAAAGSAGGAGLDVDEVFSTYLYDGTGSAQTITNNIDLSGEGGLVWIKDRSNANSHSLSDTEQGVNKQLRSDTTDSQATSTQRLTGFNSNGFTIGLNSLVNASGDDYVSWTFRKAPKFFDIQTWTGNGTAGRTISHDLGSDPGMVIIKRTDSTQNWIVHHRSLTATKYLALNLTNGEINGSDVTATSSTNITISDSFNTNGSGATYVGYFFAHNNNDGNFGPDADQDVIKCGSYAGQNSGGTDIDVNLGFEPQWLLLKPNASASWYILDNMRGIATGGNSERLFPNSSGAETSTTGVALTPTGFTVTAGSELAYASGYDILYMAIRRGPLAAPESATDVFAMDSNGLSANSEGVYFTSNFPVDFTINKERTHTSDPWVAMSRLQGNGNYLDTSSTAAEVSGISNGTFDHMTGWMQSGSAMMSWMWKRAPSFCDVVAYDGGISSTINHNLGVAPEMLWVKQRNGTNSWRVFIPSLNGMLKLNTTDALDTSAVQNLFGNGSSIVAPTATQFTVNSGNGNVNGSGNTYIAYLFATVAGVSKVGSFTGDGNTGKQIDCGFSSGARFVLIKASSGTGSWFVWDSERGIVTGNDPYLQLDNTNAEVTGGDNVDPYSSGFIVNGPGNNASGVTYIFYAIA